jgi:hypothetical protein
MMMDDADGIIIVAYNMFIVYAHVRRMSKCHLLTDAMMLFIDDGSPSEQGISFHILMLPKNLRYACYFAPSM